MSDSPAEKPKHRRSFPVGEIVAVGGLAISALALWNSWQGDDKAETTVVEQEQKPIPLALRGEVKDDGRLLVIAPVESSHSLDTLKLAANGRSAEIGSDGRVSSGEVEKLLGAEPDKSRDGQVRVAAEARYVERGDDRRGGGRYVISYRWVDGGLFSGKSLRLTGFRRG